MHGFIYVGKYFAVFFFLKCLKHLHSAVHLKSITLKTYTLRLIQCLCYIQYIFIISEIGYVLYYLAVVHYILYVSLFHFSNPIVC